MQILGLIAVILFGVLVYLFASDKGPDRMQVHCEKQNRSAYSVCVSSTKIGNTSFSASDDRRKECEKDWLGEEPLEASMHEEFKKQCLDGDTDPSICYACSNETKGLGKTANYECLEERAG